MAELITSAQNPKIKRLLALQEKSRLRREEGIFVVEGRREVERCLDAGFELDSLFICPELLGGSPEGGTASRKPSAPQTPPSLQAGPLPLTEPWVAMGFRGAVPPSGDPSKSSGQTKRESTSKPEARHLWTSRRPSTTKSPSRRLKEDSFCSESNFLIFGFCADVISSAMKQKRLPKLPAETYFSGFI